MTLRPGQVRDAIVSFLGTKNGDATVAEIREAVEAKLGPGVSPSSVRSSLNLHTGDLFDRSARGRYRLRR